MSDLVTRRSDDGQVVYVDFNRRGVEGRHAQDASFWERLELPNAPEYEYHFPPIYELNEALRLDCRLSIPIDKNSEANLDPSHRVVSIDVEKFSAETIAYKDGSSVYIINLNPSPDSEGEFYVGVYWLKESSAYSISVYSIDGPEGESERLEGENIVGGERITDAPIWFQQLVGSMNQALQ